MRTPRSATSPRAGRSGRAAVVVVAHAPVLPPSGAARPRRVRSRRRRPPDRGRRRRCAAATSRRTSASQSCCLSAWAIIRSSSGPVQPGVHRRDHAQGLEAAALGEHRGRDELELHQVAERRAGQHVPVELEPREIFSPIQDPTCLYWRTGQPSAAMDARSPARSSRSSSSSCSSLLLVRRAAVPAEHPADQLDPTGGRGQVVVAVDAEQIRVAQRHLLRTARTRGLQEERRGSAPSSLRARAAARRPAQPEASAATVVAAAWLVAAAASGAARSVVAVADGTGRSPAAARGPAFRAVGRRPGRMPPSGPASGGRSGARRGRRRRRPRPSPRRRRAGASARSARTTSRIRCLELGEPVPQLGQRHALDLLAERAQLLPDRRQLRHAVVARAVPAC